jgi:hypothetical protein
MVARSQCNPFAGSSRFPFRSAHFSTIFAISGPIPIAATAKKRPLDPFVTPHLGRVSGRPGRAQRCRAEVENLYKATCRRPPCKTGRGKKAAAALAPRRLSLERNHKNAPMRPRRPHGACAGLRARYMNADAWQTKRSGGPLRSARYLCQRGSDVAECCFMPVRFTR